LWPNDENTQCVTTCVSRLDLEHGLLVVPTNSFIRSSFGVVGTAVAVPSADRGYVPNEIVILLCLLPRGDHNELPDQEVGDMPTALRAGVY
jgi:hypothetical protein